MQNAVLYGKEGLAVSTCAGADHVDIVVRDRGPGVAPELLALIKQPFRRGQQGEGTGLGLAIASRLAEQHGGSLDVRLAPDGGFQARVRLPRTQP